MRSFLLNAIAGIIVFPRDTVTGWLEHLTGKPLPLPLAVLVYIGGLLLTSGCSAFLWLRFVRPAIDTFLVEAWKRKTLDIEQHMRAVVFAEDFKRSEERDARAREAIALGTQASTKVEAMSLVLTQLASAASQNMSAIGAVAEMVRDVSEVVSEFRKEVREHFTSAA